MFLLGFQVLFKNLNIFKYLAKLNMYVTVLSQKHSNCFAQMESKQELEHDVSKDVLKPLHCGGSSPTPRL